jgi:rhodanese-related sulfurtransferase
MMPMYRARILAAALAIALAALSSACSLASGTRAPETDLKSALRNYLSGLPAEWSAISSRELNQRLHGDHPPFLLDVREAKEIEPGYISGSVNIPVRSVMKSLDTLPAKDQPIVIVCSSGHRSALIMEALGLLGYTDVRSLAGGFPEWKSADLPVATGQPPATTPHATPQVDRDMLAQLDHYFDRIPASWSMIAPPVVKELIATSSPLQLDVRESAEVEKTGSISGATLVPLRTLLSNLDKLPPDKNALIVIECATGHRSALAMMALGLLGYDDVRSMTGGIDWWVKSGWPVAAPGAPARAAS